MDSIKVGGEVCPIIEIILIMRKCTGYSILVKEWSNLARILGTPEYKIIELRNDCMLNKIIKEDVINEIIIQWVSRSAKGPTLDKLCQALANIGLLEIAAKLWEGMCPLNTRGLTEIPGTSGNWVASNLSHEHNASNDGDLNVPGVEEQAELVEYQRHLPRERTLSLQTSILPTRGTFYPLQIEFDKLKYIQDNSRVFNSPKLGNGLDGFGPISITNTSHYQGDYRMPRDGIGLALILNIVEYDNPEKARRGSNVDSWYLAQLLPQLGYQVVLEDQGLFNRERVEMIIKDFSKICQEENPHSIVVYIGGRGKIGHILLSNLHDKMHLYRDIINKFDRKNCPGLQGKPKMFIVGTCRGDGRDEEYGSSIHSNEDYYDNMSLENTIVCYSTLPGYFSFDGKSMGTVYAYCLTQVFVQNAHKLHFLEMIKKAHEMICRTRTARPIGNEPIYHAFDFKPLYFNINPQT